jgi:capsular polysaccharide biosynthesis protein
MTLGEILSVLQARLKLLVLAPLSAGLLSLGITSFLIDPTFTASTTFLPPQQAQSSAASALASLGALGGLAGGAAGISSPGERYIALMQSVTVSDRLVDQFKLMDVYASKFRVDARKTLADHVRISLGKKDGLITVEVDDKSPQRAADMANRYVDELRRVTGTLAVTEAQQRRVFFEQQLKLGRDRLVQAQQALQTSGFNLSALKAEPKAAAEGYARIKADITGAEIRLQALRGTLTDSSSEVRQQQVALSAMREQLLKVEAATQVSGGPDYVSRYRDFKYQEALFEVYARQFELARVDESREGALIQVIDAAMPPEAKSGPKRGLIGIVTTAAFAGLLSMWVLLRALMPARPLPRRSDGNALEPVG